MLTTKTAVFRCCHYVFLLVGLCSLLASGPLFGESTVLEQDFDDVPEGFEGRFGEVFGGSDPYGLEGRWSEFGSVAGFPQVKDTSSSRGNVVSMNRVDGEPSHPLIGNFNPSYPAKRLRLECDLWVSDEESVAVSISNQNTSVAGILLRSDAVGICIWNPRDQSWVKTYDSMPVDEWFRLVIDCDVGSASYVVTIVGENGKELFEAEGLLVPDYIEDEGVNAILFNPQPGYEKEIKVDDVSVTVGY